MTGREDLDEFKASDERGVKERQIGDGDSIREARKSAGRTARRGASAVSVCTKHAKAGGRRARTLLHYRHQRSPTRE